VYAARFSFVYPYCRLLSLFFLLRLSTPAAIQEIMTTHPMGGLHWGYKPLLPANA